MRKSWFLMLCLLILVSGITVAQTIGVPASWMLHGIDEWEGNLLVQDFNGDVYSVNLEDGSNERLLSIQMNVADMAIEDGILFAIASQGERLLRSYRLTTLSALQPVPLPTSLRLGNLKLLGLEKIGAKLYILGGAPQGQSGRRLVVWDTTDETPPQFFDNLADIPELIGLQYYNGDFWAFQWPTGLLWKLRLTDAKLELVDSWNVIGGLLPWDIASGGFRGFFLGKDNIILTSISGGTGESSYLHLIDYPTDFPRESSGP